MMLTLPTNLALNSATQAIREGRVSSDLVALDLCGPKTAHAGFKDMLRHDTYLAGEMALVTFLQARAIGKPYVMLPFPTSGRLQHNCISYDTAFGKRTPRDLAGRRIGVRMYSQTTALWVRGVLQHEYGVDLEAVEWLTVEGPHVDEYTDPANCYRLPSGSDLAAMLRAGEIDAMIHGPAMPEGETIANLIPDAVAAGKAWSAREGIVPINHMFVVHRDVAQKSPQVAAEIFRLLVQSREAAAEIGPNQRLPAGLEANRKALQTGIDWAVEQKLLSEPLSVDDLFDDVTAALGA